MRETDCVWSERKGLLLARLQRRRQKEQEQRRSEQTDVRQDRLDRRRVRGEESSVAFNGSIGVKLDSEGSVVSTCTEHFILYHSSASDIFLYQLAQARHHNVLHFLVRIDALERRVTWYFVWKRQDAALVWLINIFLH